MKDKQIKILAVKQAHENISKKNHLSAFDSSTRGEPEPELESAATSIAPSSLLLDEGGSTIENVINARDAYVNVVTQEVDNIQELELELVGENNMMPLHVENSSTLNENTNNLLSSQINEGIDLQIQSVRIETSDVIEMEVQRNRDDVEVEVDVMRPFLSEGECSGNARLAGESEVTSSGGMLISSEVNSHRLRGTSEGNQGVVTDRDLIDTVDENCNSYNRNIDVCLSESSEVLPSVQASSVMLSSSAIDGTELQGSGPQSISTSAAATGTVKFLDSVKEETKTEIDETDDDSFSSLNLQYLSFMSFPFVLSSSSKAAVLECDAALQMRRGRDCVCIDGVVIVLLLLLFSAHYFYR